MNSYLIRGGQVYDGAGNDPIETDVKIRDEIIAEIGNGLTRQREELIDASGLLVTPGLIDLHTHVYSGMGIYAVDAEQAGLKCGVTTLLDTGTAGALTYPTFHNCVMPRAREDIFALLNISMIGCIQGHQELPPRIGDLHNLEHIDAPAAVACINKYRDRIVGVKVRLTSWMAAHCEGHERAGLESALQAAAQTELPLMVHHADSNIPVSEVLDVLRPGDIYTHLYHPYADNAFDDSGRAPLPALLDARARGVVCDVGHGMGAFDWDVAEPACRAHGFWPDTISTDIHVFNVQGPVFDLATTMSKFLYLGMSLPALIRATTSSPAHAMRLPHRFGLLEVGRPADITALELQNGEFPLVDVKGQIRLAKQKLRAAAVWKNGEYQRCL